MSWENCRQLNTLNTFYSSFIETREQKSNFTNVTCLKSLEKHTSLQVVIPHSLTYDNVSRCGRATDGALWHGSITAARHSRELGLRHHLQTMATLPSPWWKVNVVWEEKAFLVIICYEFKGERLNMRVFAHLSEGVCCWSVAVWDIRGRWILHSRGSFLQCVPVVPSPLNPPCGSGCRLGTQSAQRCWTVASVQGEEGDHLQRKQNTVSTNNHMSQNLLTFLSFNYPLIKLNLPSPSPKRKRFLSSDGGLTLCWK